MKHDGVFLCRCGPAAKALQFCELEALLSSCAQLLFLPPPAVPEPPQELLTRRLLLAGTPFAGRLPLCEPCACTAPPPGFLGKWAAKGPVYLALIAVLRQQRDATRLDLPVPRNRRARRLLVKKPRQDPRAFMDTALFQQRNGVGGVIWD